MISVLSLNSIGVIWPVTDFVRQFNFPTAFGDLKLKDKFHVSLIIEQLSFPGLPDKIQQIIDEFEPVFNENTPKLTGEFRLAVEGDRKTIVAPIESSAIERFQARIHEVLPSVSCEFPPHITLYMNDNAGWGIPIHSADNYARLTHDLDVEIEKTLREAWEAGQ
jgi:hypothetical protein